MSETLLAFNSTSNIALADREKWDDTLARLEIVPVYIGYDFLEYQCEYYRSSEANTDVTPLRIVYQLNGVVQMVLPVIMITSTNGVTTIDSFGGGILAPLGIRDLPESIRAKGEQELYNTIKNIAAEHRIEQLTFIINRKIHPLGKWYQKVAEESESVSITHNLYVDLSWSYEAIFANLRKSYKHLVNKAKGLWNCVVFEENITREVFEAFRDLHVAVSQRQTRSDETWDAQYHMICNKQAFLVALYNTADEMVGGAYFNYTKDEAYYSVGVYRRELFEQPLGHLSQLRAIAFMQEKGIRQYHIGRRYYKCETPLPDEKLVSISAFKQGFATHIDIETRYVLPFNRKQECS